MTSPQCSSFALDVLRSSVVHTPPKSRKLSSNVFLFAALGGLEVICTQCESRAGSRAEGGQKGRGGNSRISGSQKHGHLASSAVRGLQSSGTHGGVALRQGSGAYFLRRRVSRRACTSMARRTRASSACSARCCRMAWAFCSLEPTLMVRCPFKASVRRFSSSAISFRRACRCGRSLISRHHNRARFVEGKDQKETTLMGVRDQLISIGLEE